MNYTSINRFYGSTKGDLDFNIAGMSDGPIFGIKWDNPIRCWIFAMQSSKLKEYIAACPIKFIGSTI